MKFLLMIVSGNCRSDKKNPCPYEQTSLGHLVPALKPVNADKNKTLFKTCHEVHLANGDQCKPGTFVIAHNLSLAIQTFVTKVIEVVQIQGSVTDLMQLPDGILLQMADVQRAADGYQMPHINLSNNFLLVQFQVGHYILG